VRDDGRTVPVQLGKGKRRFKLNFAGDTGVIAPVELKYRSAKTLEITAEPTTSAATTIRWRLPHPAHAV